MLDPMPRKDIEAPPPVGFVRADVHQSALDRIARLEAALGKAAAALTEAEAILGGEYGDHYGPLCEMMLALRSDIAALQEAPQ